MTDKYKYSPEQEFEDMIFGNGEKTSEFVHWWRNYGEWCNAFNRYCDSDEIREESGRNGINACGFGIQCDECYGHEIGGCAIPMIAYAKKHNKKIDFKNMNKDYFHRLLEGDFDRKEDEQ